MGLYVTVLKSKEDMRLGQDFSLNGVSNRYEGMVVVNMEGPDYPSEKYPALYLHRRMIGGKEYLHLCPFPQGDSLSRYYSFGGNFAFTSDGRFRDYSDYPLPIHDRLE